MRIEILMLIITSIYVFNMYYDNYFVKLIMQQKKHIKLVGVLIFSFSVYLLIKKNPNNAKNILLHANDYIKYMPINKSTIDSFSPIFDFTNENHHYSNVGVSIPFMSNMNDVFVDKKVKRSVSETKKKFVASMQDWKCGTCSNKLNAWFEVDHKKRLEYGGTNDVDNLIALCRECHGKKTAMENM